VEEANDGPICGRPGPPLGGDNIGCNLAFEEFLWVTGLRIVD